MTKAEYEANRPKNEQKIEFDKYVVRSYVDDKGELHVLAHRKVDGYENLPLAYLLGTNSLIMPVRK